MRNKVVSILLKQEKLCSPCMVPTVVTLQICGCLCLDLQTDIKNCGRLLLVRLLRFYPLFFKFVLVGRQRSKPSMN